MNTNDYSVVDTDPAAAGDQPLGLGVGSHSPDESVIVADRLYVADAGTASVIVVDPVTSAVAQNIPGGSGPFKLPARGNDLYVSHYQSSAVTVINTDTDSVITAVNVGSSSGWMALRGNRLHVGTPGSHSVSVINADTNNLVDTHPVTPGVQPLSVGSGPWGVAVVGHTLYVFNRADDSVTVFDLNAATLV